MGFDKRTLHEVIDSVSEKAKAPGVPDSISGGLLVDVMRLREIHLHFAKGSGDPDILGEPALPQQ